MTAPYTRAFGNTPGAGPLRDGGISVSEQPQKAENLPSTPSESAKRQAPSLVIVRDLADGNERVKAKGKRYLPQEPGESDENYRIRLERSVFFNVFGETCEGLTGFVFSKDPVLSEDVPVQIRGVPADDEQPKVEGHWENIDNAGTHGDVFCRDIFQDALTAGHAAIFVEFPNTEGEQLHRDERGASAPIRPYWIPILKENILSWRTAVEQGKTVLTQVVLQECTMVPDGAFGEKEQTQYRVLYRRNGVVGWALLAVTEDKRILVVGEGTYPTQVEIPLAEVRTSGRKSLFESKPPLLDLAFLNIAHYQGWSDYRNSQHKTCCPIYTECGVDPNDKSPVILGPNAVRRFTNPQGGAKYVSHDGSSLGSIKQALDDLKADMAVLGLQMLAPQTRSAETAEAKRLDKGKEASKLGTAARGLQDGVERALGFHARYLKLSGGSIAINRDFESEVMDAATMAALGDLAAKLGIPVRVILEEMQGGGRFVGQDLDVLEAEMEANQKAKEDQKAAEDAAALDTAIAVQNAKMGKVAA